MSDFYIDDGYTCRKAVAAAAGLHPAFVVTYRPATGQAKIELRMCGSPERAFVIENQLIERQRVAINGEPVTADKAARLKPAVRDEILNLVYGYAGSDEEAADAKN